MVQPLRNNFGAIPRLIDGKYWSNYNTPIFGWSMAPISA